MCRATLWVATTTRECGAGSPSSNDRDGRSGAARSGRRQFATSTYARKAAHVANICIVILDHRNDGYLRDLVDSIRRFCPGADLAWYNSGPDAASPGTPAATLPTLPNSRPLRYAKV